MRYKGRRIVGVTVLKGERGHDILVNGRYDSRKENNGESANRGVQCTYIYIYIYYMPIFRRM